MQFNNPNVQLTPRAADDNYYLQINQAALDILSLVFEFKLAASWHISRFLTQQDKNKYLYTKLRRMWQGGYLERFQVHSGELVGIPVFFTLSAKALKTLAEHHLYSPNQIKKYPKPKTLFAHNLFNHENQVIELASMEAKNQSKDLNLSFKGEVSSQSAKQMNELTIEVLTPDYTVYYTFGGITECVFSELERTQKSKAAMIRKIERYANYLSPEQRVNKTLRLIFENENFEQSFWLTLYGRQPWLLQSVRIVTTNLSLITAHHHFLEKVYSTQDTVQLVKPGGRLAVDSSRRVKLFGFLKE